VSMPITSPVDFISGRAVCPHPGTWRRERRFLHRDMLMFNALREPDLGQRLSRHDRAASFASGTPMALLTKGTVREARGLTSRT